MTVAFDNKGESYSSSSPATVTFLVGSGSNRALIAELCFGVGALPSGLSVVWDAAGANQSLTQISGAIGTRTGGAPTSTALFGLVNPASGNKTLTVSWTGTVNDCYVCGVSWTGVDQTGGATSFPHGTGTTNAASATTGSITVTSQTGNAIIASFCAFENTTAQSDTALFYDHVGAVANGSGNWAAGSASHALTNTFGASSGSWSAAACDIQAVADVTDNFNRANGGLGSNWIASQDLSPTGHQLQIFSNQVTTQVTGEHEAAYWSDAVNTFQNDQYAQVTIIGGGAGGGPIVRHQTTGHSSFYLLFASVPNNQRYLFRCDNGTFTQLGGITTGVSGGDVFRLEIVGTLLTAKRNGTAYTTFTDATYSSGQPGIEAFDTGATDVDDWLGGPIAAGSVGSASGSGTATGVGASLASAVGTATGISSVSGVGASLAKSVGASSGTSVVTGVGASLAASVGASFGTSTVLGVGATSGYVGTASGISTVLGVGASLVASVGSSHGISTVSGVGSSIGPISAVGTASGLATVIGISSFIPPVSITGTYFALNDLYLPDGRYIEAGEVFTGPSGWIPAVAVDPIDDNAIQAYWDLGPVMMEDVEISRALFPHGSGGWRTGVVARAPKIYWKPAPGGGFILTGAGAALGPKYP